jgi:HPt (histidine-containing phosphotransfer) domain-containing protein
MTNNEPSRLDRMEQQLKRLKEPAANISMEELSQKISKLKEEAIQQLEAQKAGEQSAPSSWQEESEQHRALMRQKLEKLAEQRMVEKEKIDRLDQSFKTIRLLAWLSFALIFCASATVIFTSIYE